MNIGIFSYFGYPIPLEDRAKMISNAGFKSVMLWWANDIKDNPPTSKQPELFRKHGLEIANAHLPFDRINALWDDNLDGESLYEMLAACVSDCGTYDIPVAVMHVSRGDTPPKPSDIGFDRIKRLTALGEKLNVDIAFENTRNLDYLDLIFSRIKSDRLKFCYDSGHEYAVNKMLGIDIDLLEKYGDKLAALHLHDNDGTGDQHLMPFDGTAPWEEIMARLRITGYKGDLTLENEATKKDIVKYSPEEYLAESMKRARRLLCGEKSPI